MLLQLAVVAVSARTLAGLATTPSTVTGAPCTSQDQCGTQSSYPYRPLYCRNDNTCQPKGYAGADCESAFACLTPLLYCSTSTAQPGHENKCLALGLHAGQDCSQDYAHQCYPNLFCQESSAGGANCQDVGEQVGADCADDLTGNACDATAGLYCSTMDQTCQAISTTAGQSCGPDSNACQATAGLYCVAATQLCAQKATYVGASCSFDPVNGCTTTSGGDALYCRPQDETCQVQLITIGADCRNDPITGCSTATSSDGTTTPLYCSLPTFQCAAKVEIGASCASNPAQACARPSNCCSSNNKICVPRATSQGDPCNRDPYAQCGFDRSYGLAGQLYPLIYLDRDDNQVCKCYRGGPFSPVPPAGSFGLTSIGDDCSSDPTFACGYSASEIKLYCAPSTNTCQQRITLVGSSCAYDYLGACGSTSDGTQLYPSIPVGSTGHADCTCVTQADVVVRPSSRARARARARRSLSLCPGSHTACPVGNGFECVDVQSNIEQCGGCSTNGGVDCTALGGVAAVGCVGGRCEIWACEADYSFDAAREECVKA